MNNNKIINNNKIRNLKQESIHYFKNISVEIIILILIIYTCIININRFSIKTVFLNITNKQIVFLANSICLLCVLMIIYCKHFTLLNLSDIKTNLMPIFFIFVPFITFLIVIYLNTNKYIKEHEIGYEDINDDRVINKFSASDNLLKFSPPPKMIPPKIIRIVVQVLLLLIILYEFKIFRKFFKLNESRTILDKILSGNEKTRFSRLFIYILLVTMTIINILILYQQYDYSHCKLGLPQSWNF
jgi:hypothetical protein